MNSNIEEKILQIRDRHLEKFRQAKGADSKALYQKRLSNFIEELVQEIK